MLEFKAGLVQRLPVRLVADPGGTPLAGVAFNLVSMTVEKADGSTDSLAPSALQWVEAVDGAFYNQGKYSILVPAGMLNQPGVLTYAVSATGAKTYVGAVKVIANEEAETHDMLEGVRDDVTDLLDYHQGKWQIHVTGPDANRLVLYRADGTTVLKKFDLQNANGDATYINPFRRNPV